MKQVVFLELGKTERCNTYQSNIACFTFKSYELTSLQTWLYLEKMFNSIIPMIERHAITDEETCRETLYHVVLLHSFSSVLMQEISEYMERVKP